MIIKTFFEKVKRTIYRIILHFYRVLIFSLIPASDGINREKREIPIIVSLTTIPDRFHTVGIVLKTLLRQTMKPDKIILYLDEELKTVPLSKKLQSLVTRGICIEYRKNIKSHKKYYYAMQEHSEAIIITIDDDIYYPFDLIETLYHSYQKYSNCISAMRIHKIRYDKDGLEISYDNWEKVYNKPDAITPSLDFIATGGAGTLYPPHIMPKETFDIESIKQNAYEQDDIWLKYIELKNNIKVVKASLKKYHCLDILGSQKSSLKSTNIPKQLNDIAVKNMRNYINHQ